MSLSVFYKNWKSPQISVLAWRQEEEVVGTHGCLFLKSCFSWISSIYGFFSQFVNDISHVLQPHLFTLLSWDRWVFSIKGRWLRRELHHKNKQIFKLNIRFLFLESLWFSHNWILPLFAFLPRSSASCDLLTPCLFPLVLLFFSHSWIPACHLLKEV